MNKKNKAIINFQQGYNCAQAIFSAYSDRFKIDKKTAKFIAAGFGAGIGRMQRTCGAVTGAVMLIGCKYFNENDISGSKNLVYKKAREFIEKFEKINKTSNCLELLGVDINTEEGIKVIRKKNLAKKNCEKYVKDICSILKEII